MLTNKVLEQACCKLYGHVDRVSMEKKTELCFTDPLMLHSSGTY